jgi:hypothetical protein
MPKQHFFQGAGEYAYIEGKARATLQVQGSNDSRALERILFKEKEINDIVLRLTIADLKIDLLFHVIDRHNLYMSEISSENISLESDLLEDALQANLLEVAELVAEFIFRLRGPIPGTYGHLFRQDKNALGDSEENEIRDYEQSRAFLFPHLDEKSSNGRVSRDRFNAVAERLETKAQALHKFRNKRLAHKFDKKRFAVALSYEQYSEIRLELRRVLDAVAMVGVFSSNDWSQTQGKKEIDRATKWLLDGLIASVGVQS